jgi:hypothetical protein
MAFKPGLDTTTWETWGAKKLKGKYGKMALISSQLEGD